MCRAEISIKCQSIKIFYIEGIKMRYKGLPGKIDIGFDESQTAYKNIDLRH